MEAAKEQSDLGERAWLRLAAQSEVVQIATTRLGFGSSQGLRVRVCQGMGGVSWSKKDKTNIDKPNTNYVTQEPTDPGVPG